MAVPVQRTWVTGEVVTAAELNANIRDAVNFLLATPRCVLIRSTSLSVANSSSPQVINFDTELVDSDTMHTNTAQARMTVNTAGRYEFEIYVHYEVTNVNAAGTIHSGIAKNTTTSWNTGKVNEDTRLGVGDHNGLFFGDTTFCRSDQFMNAGDYMSFWTAQVDTAGSMTINGGTPFSLQAVGRWVSSS